MTYFKWMWCYSWCKLSGHDPQDLYWWRRAEDSYESSVELSDSYNPPKDILRITKDKYSI